MKLLITGFDAFGQDKINPSYQALLKLPDQINEIEIIKRQLPTKYKMSQEVLIKAIEEVKPDFVIAVGQAEGRKEISLEKVALNLMTANIQDNAGFKPVDQVIEPTGETAYFTNLPLENIYQNLRAQNVKVKISYSAGTFVCNKVFYDLMYLINNKKYNFKAGFIHIPLLPSQLKLRSKPGYAMNLSDSVLALEIIISSLCD